MADEERDSLITFVRHMKAALADKDIEKMLHEPTMELIKRMDNRVAVIEEVANENKSDITDIQGRLDEVEQKERATNMILTIDNNLETTTKTTVKNLLNDKLNINVNENEIKYVLRLGTNESKPTKIRVVFNDETRKKEIMEKKKQLKGKKMWLSDDLTPYRSNLAFLARKAAKERRIHDTWVTDSKVFVQAKAKDTPKRIQAPKDLPI